MNHHCLATSDTPPWLVPAIIGGFLIVFPLLWCGVLLLLSRVGGWSRLAARYGAKDFNPTGTRHSWATGRVGGVNYNSCLVIHFHDDGFFLETQWMFRPGHPRLFIPWAEITSRREGRLFFWKHVKLEIGTPPAGTISLPQRLLNELPQSAAQD